MKIAIGCDGAAFELKEAIKGNLNANVLCMGAKVTCRELAFEIVGKLLTTEFRGGANKTKSDRIENIWT